ncbi:MAG: hypothetical protein FJ148_18830 [Deltaproteobacteria bacterium]|nr:hypothetical protein [Deltaproteobacteria bacterium]
MSPRTTDHDDATFAASGYPLAIRLGTGLLLAASALSLPVLLARVLLANDPPMTPPVVLRAFLALSVLPALASLVLQRALRGEVALDRENVAVRVGGYHVDVPIASIAAIEPWRLPLPQAGFGLRLASGKRFALGLGADDPMPLLAALEARGVPTVEAARRHPVLVYARTRQRLGRLGWRRTLLKYPLFGAMVAGVLFNAHQHIAYGGLLGQYYLEGAWPWARTFLVYWSTATIYMVLYASAWRWPAEIVAWLASHRGEAFATRVRRVVEWVCRIAYYAGVGLVLALRFAD